MKKISLLIIGVTLGFATMAQVPEDLDPLNGLDTVQMAKFIGKWKSKSKKTSFTLIIKKKKIGPIPLLLGWYQYTENGKIVINYLDSLDKAKTSGLAGFAKKGNDTLKISFTDITRDELSHGTLNFVKGNLNKLLFKINDEKRHGPHFRFTIEKRPIFTKKIPYDLNMIMNRIE